MNCHSCAAVQAEKNLFCTNCGAYQGAPLPAGPFEPALSERNPLSTVATGLAPGTPPSKESIALLRARIATSLSSAGPEWVAGAEAQFDNEFAPRLRSGAAGGEFFLRWLAHWEHLPDLARREHFLDSGNTFAARHERLVQATARSGDSTELLAFPGRALRAGKELTLARLKIEALALVVGAEAFKGQLFKVTEFLFLLPPNALIRRLELIGQWRDSLTERFSLHDARNAELTRRHVAMVAALDKLLDPNAESMIRDPRPLLAAVTKGWPVDETTRQHVLEMTGQDQVREFQNEIYKLIFEQVLGALEKFRQEIERRKQERDDDEAAAGQERERSKLVEELVTTQQATRQLSEGKGLSAWATATFGAAAGAFVEGLTTKDKK